MDEEWEELKKKETRCRNEGGGSLTRLRDLIGTADEAEGEGTRRGENAIRGRGRDQERGMRQDENADKGDEDVGPGSLRPGLTRESKRRKRGRKESLRVGKASASEAARRYDSDYRGRPWSWEAWELLERGKQVVLWITNAVEYEGKRKLRKRRRKSE